jgi:NADPH-dependent 2,4-dienoyl-CoA reductase/sulfur reductase-like enzyme
LGKEEEMRIKPADVKKKVLIAGAGPAGMEAAMVAAKRGHEVHVFEKSNRVGGSFIRLPFHLARVKFPGLSYGRKSSLKITMSLSI